MLQFQYAKVSENNTAFSNYRGIKVLSSLFANVSDDEKQQQSMYPIHSVCSVPGHLAVSFHDGRQFVVFDAVPQQLQLSAIEEEKLRRFVLCEVNDYLKNILAMKTLSNVICLKFLNHRKLQLLAVHSDGTLIIWHWNQIRFLWQYKVRKILPSPLSDSKLNKNNERRPGILAFCSVITSPPHFVKVLNESFCSDANNQKNDSLYFLTIDYMLGIDEEQSCNIHRYLLNSSFPGIHSSKDLSIRFIVCCHQINASFDSLKTQTLMDGLEEIEFWTEYYCKDDNIRRRVVMIIENIWTTKYGFIIEATVRKTNNLRKETMASAMSSDSNTSSQRAYNVDLSEVNIEKRLFYYLSPSNNQMIRIPFPSTQCTKKQYQSNKNKKNKKQKLTESNLCELNDGNNEISFIPKSKQEIMRFVIGQHGTTKQLLLLDRFDSAFYILDESELPKSSLSEYEHSFNKNKKNQRQKHGDKLSKESLNALAPKFNIPFGHFSDKCRAIKWKFICRFDLPSESFFDPTHKIAAECISKKYKTINQEFKIWGFRDWICCNVLFDVFSLHLTNIVMHRRHSFHKNKNDKKQNAEAMRLQFPSPIYSSPLYKRMNLSTEHQIGFVAVASLPVDVDGDFDIIHNFGIFCKHSIYIRFDAHLCEQVNAVNSGYFSCQSVLGALNFLSRWSTTSLIFQSKYLTNFLLQQSQNNDSIKAQQITQALKIVPFPILVALLFKYSQFDSLLLRHYKMRRDEFPKFCFNFARIFGQNTIGALLVLLLIFNFSCLCFFGCRQRRMNRTKYSKVQQIATSDEEAMEKLKEIAI